MIKTITLLSILGMSILFAGYNLHGGRQAEFNRASAADARVIVEEYSRAVRVGDRPLLETLMHASASKQEYVRFRLHESYGLYDYDRHKMITEPRFSAPEWASVESKPERIEILTSTEMTASASLSSVWGTEYLHLLRVRGTWQIVHVLGIDPGRAH